jgi:putative nucleotidyltransferase with HDIG domain
MINELRALVESACKKKTNYFGYGLWEHHIVHVIDFARQMAKKTGADDEIVEIAAILHDYASAKDYKLFSRHNVHGARLAREILKEYNYPPDRIEQVAHVILSHSGAENRQVKRLTKEDQCVADADAMAHFASTPSLFYLAFFSHKMDINEATEWLMAKLDRSWRKLSPKAKELVKDRYEAAKLLYGRHN